MFSESGNITVNMLCTIDYVQEGSTNIVSKTSQSEGQAAEDGRRIEINLSDLGQSTTYTFVVTATNGTTTVNVEGSFTTSGKLCYLCYLYTCNIYTWKLRLI